jgi:hypothetical protein
MAMTRLTFALAAGAAILAVARAGQPLRCDEWYNW